MLSANLLFHMLGIIYHAPLPPLPPSFPPSQPFPSSPYSLVSHLSYFGPHGAVRLNLRPSRPSRPIIPMSNPEKQHAHRRDQPKQRIHQIHPNRVLHPLHARIALRPLLDVHIAKQAEERDPQDEEDRVADPGERDAGCEWDEVEQGEDGGEGGGYFCVDLFCVSR